MSDYAIKQHDLEPPLAVLTSDGVATFDQVVSWRMLIQVGTTVYVDTSPGVVLSNSNLTAVVTHEWVAGETDVARSECRVEVEATWPTGRPQTFPPRGYLSFPIVADLG